MSNVGISFFIYFFIGVLQCSVMRLRTDVYLQAKMSVLHSKYLELCSDCRQIRFASQIRILFILQDQNFVSRHHQPVCMSYCGNNIWVSNYLYL